MIGRRYNEGLHQAIEAKEGVQVAAESKTLATITFQNYFRMYEKLAGMTGTASTEADEFSEIYGLNIVISDERTDKSYRHESDKQPLEHMINRAENRRLRVAEIPAEIRACLLYTSRRRFCYARRRFQGAQRLQDDAQKARQIS